MKDRTLGIELRTFRSRFDIVTNLAQNSVIYISRYKIKKSFCFRFDIINKQRFLFSCMLYYCLWCETFFLVNDVPRDKSRVFHLMLKPLRKHLTQFIIPAHIFFKKNPFFLTLIINDFITQWNFTSFEILI